MSDEQNNDWQSDNGLTVSPVKPDLKQPPKYQVLMLLHQLYFQLDFN